MKRRNFVGFTLLLCFFVFLTGITIGQRDASRKNLAEISNHGTSVSWHIDAPYRVATLTVSAPDGKVYRQEFPAGTTPVFSLLSADGTRFGDGGFKYEIVLTPNIPDGVQEVLRSAREEGRGDEVYESLVRDGTIPPRMADSGAFKLIDGMIYSADSGPEPGIETKIESAADKSEGMKTARVDKSEPNDLAPGDVVFNDDVIIIGSNCTGLDCVNGENFGFDTLRLKENNLRINFADTSNTANFPTNDWRIVANDSTNGGDSYLAFEDSDAGNIPFRVEAGAGANALVVETGGNVGLGTINPALELHIVDGDTPTVRLEQNGSSGFTPQTWDVAGNETNFFVRDATNGSTLPFKIRPGANNDSLVISNTSNVGVGVGTSPAEKLDVGGNVQANGDFIIKSGSTGGIVFADGTIQTTAGGGGGGGGEVNTASNVGAGTGIFKQKIGANLEFKTLTAGSNVTIAPSGADSVQISSAATSPLGPAYATTIFGGSGQVNPVSTLTPTFDANSFGFGTSGAGFAVLLYNVPGNSNLADPGGTNVVFKIRYRDSDGVGAGTSVTVDQVTINVAGGTRTVNSIFNSNTNAGTGFQTVTVCKPANFFNFSTLGNHITVALVSAAGTMADFTMVQMYKTDGPCP